VEFRDLLGNSAFLGQGICTLGSDTTFGSWEGVGSVILVGMLLGK
jgi:hypothetical protein